MKKNLKPIWHLLAIKGSEKCVGSNKPDCKDYR